MALMPEARGPTNFHLLLVLLTRDNHLVWALMTGIAQTLLPLNLRAAG